MTEILWHWGYWDGPLSGLCHYNGRVCWFSCFAMGGWQYIGAVDGEDDCSWTPRIYRVHRLSWLDAQKSILGHWIFQKTVGSRRMTRAWYNVALPLFQPGPGPVIGAFSESEYWQSQ